MTRMTENDARDLLPWYAANALEPEERAAIDALLETSESLRTELAQLSALEEGVTDTAGEPQWNPALIQDAFEQIDAYEAEKNAPGVMARLGAWVDTNLLAGWDGVPNLAKLAVAAQFVLLLAVGGAWLAGSDTPPGDYRTVGVSPNAVQLKLQFHPEVDEATLRRTLSEIDGRIVDGPSALGLYTVQIDSLEKDQVEEFAQVLADLLAKEDVIKYAQPGD